MMGMKRIRGWGLRGRGRGGAKINNATFVREEDCVFMRSQQKASPYTPLRFLLILNNHFHACSLFRSRTLAGPRSEMPRNLPKCFAASSGVIATSHGSFLAPLKQNECKIILDMCYSGRVLEF